MKKRTKMTLVFFLAPAVALILYHAKYLIIILLGFLNLNSDFKSLNKPFALINKQEISRSDIDLEYELLLSNYLKNDFKKDKKNSLSSYGLYEHEFSEPLKREIFYTILENKLSVEICIIMFYDYYSLFVY